MNQTWVKYVIVLNSNTFLRCIELVLCIGTYEICLLSKRANPAFWSSRLAQLDQASSNRVQKSIRILKNYVSDPGLYAQYRKSPPSSAHQGKKPVSANRIQDGRRVLWSRPFPRPVGSDLDLHRSVGAYGQVHGRAQPATKGEPGFGEQGIAHQFNRSKHRFHGQRADRGGICASHAIRNRRHGVALCPSLNCTRCEPPNRKALRGASGCFRYVWIRKQQGLAPSVTGKRRTTRSHGSCTALLLIGCGHAKITRRENQMETFTGVLPVLGPRLAVRFPPPPLGSAAARPRSRGGRR